MTEKGGEYLKHEQQNFELDDKIRLAKDQLAELEKQSKLSNLMGDALVKATKKRKDEDTHQVDINHLMDTLMKEIVQCYPTKI